MAETERLTTIIAVEDEASEALQSIANVGQAAAQVMASAGDAASASFESAHSVIEGTQTALANIANAASASFEAATGAMDHAAGAADGLTASATDATGTMSGFADAATGVDEIAEGFSEGQEAVEQTAMSLRGASDAATQYSAEAADAAGATDSFAGSRDAVEGMTTALEGASVSASDVAAAAEDAAAQTSGIGESSDAIEGTANAADHVAMAMGGAATAFEGASTSAGELAASLADATMQTAGLGQTASEIEGVAEAADHASVGVDGLVSASERAGGTAGAFSEVRSSVEETAGAYDGASASAENYAAATEGAAAAAGHWTELGARYNTTLMEMLYTTEELVDAGYKTQGAMDELNEMYSLCDQAAHQLSLSLDAQKGIQADLAASIKEAESAYAQLSTAQQEACAASGEYEAALANAQAALENQAAANATAEAAMQSYDATMKSGTEDLRELEAAAESAMHAGEDLAAANGEATNAMEALRAAVEAAQSPMEDLGETSSDVAPPLEEVGTSAEDATQKSIEGLTELENLLASVGISVKLRDIAAAMYEIVDAAGQAQSTVMLATGATGDALDGLTNDMVNAFGAARYTDLQNTAVGIGEVNTRMGLTGTELAKATNKFTDFANVTGGSVQSSVAAVTQIMNKWGLESSSLDNILDQLVYTGQATGISVDSLAQSLVNGQAQFSQMGISVEGAISLLGALELQGVNSSSVLMGLRTAVKGFAADGQEGSAGLEQTIAAIQGAGSAAEATSIACEVFGTRAGVELAAAVRSGVISVETLQGNLDKATGSLQKTADASLTMGQQWEQSQNRMKVAWATSTEPMMTGFMQGLTNIVNGIADFASEHKELVAALTGAAVGFGALLAVLAGYSLAMKIATAATTAFGVATGVALGPIALIAAAIGGVIALVTTLTQTTDEETAAYEAATPASREHADAVRELQAEYDALVESSGEAVAAQSDLAGELAAAKAEYELTYQTMEELQQANADAIASSQDFNARVKEQVASLAQAPTAAQAYISRLIELGSQSSRTAGEMSLMEGLVSQLNSMYPELGASVDDFIDASSGVADSLQEQIEAMQSAADQQAYLEMYEEATKEQAQLQVRLDLTNQELADATERWEEYADSNNVGCTAAQDAQEQMFVLQGEVENLESKLSEATEYTSMLGEGIARMGEDAETSADRLQAAFDAMNSATQGQVVGDAVFVALQDEITSVCDAYDQAAAAASDSLMRQADAWHALEADTSTSLQDVMSNMDTSISTMQSYGDNLTAIHDYMVNQLHYTEEAATQALDTLNTGTPEAIGLTQQLAADMQAGGSAVGDYVQKTRELQSAADETGSKMAQTQSDIQAAFQQIETDAKAIMEKLDMSADAKAKAETTFQSYLDAMNPKLNTMKEQAQNKGKEAADSLAREMKSGTSEAASAIQHVIDTINQIPPSKTFTLTYNQVTTGSAPAAAGKVGMHAGGTHFSTEDVYVAGEQGPELIVGGYGSTVYTADETRNIFDALSTGRAVDVEPSGSLEPIAAGGEGYVPAGERTVNINLNGDAVVRSDGSMSPAQIVSILQDNMRPVLLGIIKEEVYEEGAGVYAH